MTRSSLLLSALPTTSMPPSTFRKDSRAPFAPAHIRYIRSSQCLRPDPRIHISVRQLAEKIVHLSLNSLIPTRLLRSLRQQRVITNRRRHRDTARGIVHQDRSVPGKNVVGVEVVDGQVVGEHRRDVVVERRDGDRGAVAGLESVADPKLLGRGPSIGCRVPV